MDSKMTRFKKFTINNETRINSQNSIVTIPSLINVKYFFEYSYLELMCYW